MCPDRDLISAYVDGEVPSPWRERLEEHLGGCQACSALVSGYAHLGERLRAELVCNEAESLSRGRSRLDALLEGRPAPIADSWKARRHFVSLPLPFAAAAAVFVLLLCATTTFLALKPNRGTSIQTVASGEFSPLSQEVKAQPASMDELLRYLDARDGQVTLTIKLPSGTTFGSAGKPVIMRSGRVVHGPATGTTVGGPSP
jgi:anti-sigma factor RsiW